MEKKKYEKKIAKTNDDIVDLLKINGTTDNYYDRHDLRNLLLINSLIITA